MSVQQLLDEAAVSDDGLIHTVLEGDGFSWSVMWDDDAFSAVFSLYLDPEHVDLVAGLGAGPSRISALEMARDNCLDRLADRRNDERDARLMCRLERWVDVAGFAAPTCLIG